MPAKLIEGLSLLRQIASETTVAGAAQYARYKRQPIRQLGGPRMPSCGIGIVGAGEYAASVLLPCVRAHGEPVYAVTSRTRERAVKFGAAFNIPICDGLRTMINDERCHALLIATPHHLHPEQIAQALDSGLYTYCEKPVAIDEAGLERLSRAACVPAARRVMIGFNRRFSPAIRRLMETGPFGASDEAKELHYRVNFGPRGSHWISDPDIGGGRIHGVVCHYVDLVAFLGGAPITDVSAVALRSRQRCDHDTFTASMRLANGSVASLTFTSEGRREFAPKEELQVSCLGSVARLVDFKELWIDGQHYRYRRHRMGAMGAMGAFLRAKETLVDVPVPLVDGIRATSVTMAMQRSLCEFGSRVEVAPRDTTGGDWSTRGEDSPGVKALGGE